MHRECFLNSAQTLQYRYPKTYDEMVRAIVTPEVEWQLLARAAQLTDLTHEQVWGALIGGVRRADRARENGPFTPLELMARSTSRISAENPPSPYLVA
jgi:hypothetical protein